MMKQQLEVMPSNGKNNDGDLREWACGRAFGITRNKHDSGRYDRGSDVEVGERKISVKYGGFSLMHGNLCEGQTTMEGIWSVYETHTHSNEFAYISKAFVMYLMTLAEFKEFIFTFGSIQHESTKNGGKAKIKCNGETKKRIAWLEARCAN